MRRAIFLFGLLLSKALASGTIDAFGLRWTAPFVTDWRIEPSSGGPVLTLLKPRPSETPRRPTQFVRADNGDYIRVTLECEVKKEPKAARNRRTSVILVYAYRDASHFNYAHLSEDAAEQAAHHNGIFHVYGGDRVRISAETGPASLPEDQWYKVRLEYDGRTGRVDVYVDGKTSPSLQAVDMSLGAGKVGIGSFFDMGQFRNVKISGELAAK